MDSSLCFSLLLITLLSMDALIFGLSYGIDNVSVSPLCMIIISLISAAVLTLSFLSGDLFLSCIPSFIAKWLPFLVLLLLALYKLYDALPIFHRKNEMTTETLSRRINQKEPPILSPKEAVVLAITLSVDNLCAGLGVGTLHVPFLILFLYSVMIHFVTIYAGWRAGKYFSSRCSRNLSLGGAILLLLLAFLQLH